MFYILVGIFVPVFLIGMKNLTLMEKIIGYIILAITLVVVNLIF